MNTTKYLSDYLKRFNYHEINSYLGSEQAKERIGLTLSLLYATIDYSKQMSNWLPALRFCQSWYDQKNLPFYFSRYLKDDKQIYFKSQKK